MVAKNSLILSDEFILYCKLNKIEDIESFAKEVFEIGFNFKKYGNRPTSLSEGKEKTNQRFITSPRPTVEAAPQPIKNKKLYDE